MTINHGLQQNQLELIKNICKNFASHIDKVSFFGSRATGAYKDYESISKIKIRLYGDYNVIMKSLETLLLMFRKVH